MKTNHKPLPLRLLAALGGILVILCILMAYEGFAGDPLSRKWAERRAVAYAAELYPGQTFTVTNSSYTQFSFRYDCEVQSAQSVDTHFIISTRFWFQTDDQRDDGNTSHEYLVENGWNSSIRMEREAEVLAEAALTETMPELVFPDNDAAGYTLGVNSADVDVLLFYEKLEENDEIWGSRPLDFPGQWKLDAPFEKSLLQQVPASLELSMVWDGEPSEADLQNVLHTVKQTMEKAELPFAFYSVTLTPSGVADHAELYDKLAACYNIPADEIG